VKDMAVNKVFSPVEFTLLLRKSDNKQINVHKISSSLKYFEDRKCRDRNLSRRRLREAT
jgi:hypothetical protein